MKTEITIPDDLNEITVKQYKKFLTVTKDLEGEFYKQRFVEILCNIPYSTVRLMTKRSVDEIVAQITELLNSEVGFAHRFKIQNQEFGFITDLEEMTSGEYSDLTKYIGDWQTMNNAMAVLFRPIILEQKDKYTIIDYEGTKDYYELMDFMPLGIAMGAMVFFSTLMNDLLNAIQVSIAQEMAKEITAPLHSSEKSGDGTKTSTHLLEENLKRLIMLQNEELTNA
jgi:hypothetical protein